MINHNAPFPQANDFNKIFTIIGTDEEKLKDYSYMQVLLGDITGRQVDYYLSACVYLGLITHEKKYTDEGNKIRKMSGMNRIAATCRLVVSDEIFGMVYFESKLLGVELERDDIVAIMKDYISFESEAMYVRRASTVHSWVQWILDSEEQTTYRIEFD